MSKVKSVLKKVLLFIPLVITGVIIYVLLRNRKSTNSNLIEYLAKRTKQDVDEFTEAKEEFDNINVRWPKEKEDEIIEKGRSMHDRINNAAGPDELIGIESELRRPRR